MKTSANKLYYITLLTAFIFSPLLFGLEIDEDALFSEDSMTIETGEHLREDVGDFFEKESVTFSGKLLARGIYAMDREWLFENGERDNNSLSNTSEADFFLDVRLKKGIKGFFNLSVLNTAQQETNIYFDQFPSASEDGNETEDDFDTFLKEFFIDANAQKKVWVRLGKQVVKWGRTYFWNPTDFINIEKKNFFDMYRYREGVYGARIHASLGSHKNIYAFLDFSSAEDAGDVGLALKYEFILKKTEASLSCYSRQGIGYALGVDVSGRYFGVDLNSEVAFINEDNHLYVDMEGDTPALGEKKDEKNLRWSLGLTKTFDYELKDRISLIYEFFYNRNGYDENLFKNDAAVILLFFNDKEEVLYEPNYHGKYYSAIFFSINKFPIYDMMINLSVLANMSDGSYAVVPGCSYTPIDYFTLMLNIDIFGGPEKAEYTWPGTAVAFDFSMSVEF